MKTDDELIAERKRADARKFLISVLDPEIAPILSGPMRALRTRLQAGGWIGWAAALATMLRANDDLAVKTADGQIRALIVAGFVERRGEYVRGRAGAPATDGRAIRLIEWPDQ